MLHPLKKYLFLLAIIATIGVVGFTYEFKGSSGQLQNTHSLLEHISSKVLFPSASPDRIILNLTEDPVHSVAVNWRTDTTVLSGTVEVALAEHGPQFQEKARSIEAHTETYHYKSEHDPPVYAHFHSAVIDGLKANTLYVYRVGQGEAWSEWFQIRTPDPDNAVSLIYFGDAQNNVKSMWSRVIREAFATMPQVDFMLHAGDLINRHDRDVEWGEWFYAGGFIHAMIPSVMTPGNHEYGKDGKLSPQWRPQFNLPQNGPNGLEEVCYQINYPNLKVVSLDAEQIDESEHFRQAQAQWLDSVLLNDPRKWTAITFHYPVYSTKPNRDNIKLRNAFKPVFDKHRVDIVLQGHDHGYGRGTVSNEPTGAQVRDEKAGTVYVVSVSGPKMYDVSDDPWMDRKAANTQLFQIITIEDNTLQYKAYTATGMLYDAFDLVKRAGKANLQIDKIPDTPEMR
jgi:hypothetical protein